MLISVVNNNYLTEKQLENNITGNHDSNKVPINELAVEDLVASYSNGSCSGFNGKKKTAPSATACCSNSNCCATQSYGESDDTYSSMLHSTIKDSILERCSSSRERSDSVQDFVDVWPRQDYYSNNWC